MTRDPDRLYDLLPVVHRQRDIERGEPLRALLQVIAEQVGVIEDDLERQYANWFIETCDDWVIPYIGALIGYQAPPQLAEDGGRTGRLSSVLTPRRAVANTIRDRRRKGSPAAFGADRQGHRRLAGTCGRVLSSPELDAAGQSSPARAREDR